MSGSERSPDPDRPIHADRNRDVAFTLRCFTPPPAGLALEGSVERSGDWLRLRYRLIDPQGLVRIPAQAATPQRRDGLWEHTCLEAFLAEPGAERYWEVNLAPSGDWNVYRLSAYRQGLTAEDGIRVLPFAVSRHADGLDLEVSLDLAALPMAALPLAVLPLEGLPQETTPQVAMPQASRPLQLGITAVLELQSGEILYWALNHPGEQADFHLREGFALRV